MTAKQPRPSRTRDDSAAIGLAPGPEQKTTHAPPVLAGPVPPIDRLDILDSYAGSDGLLPVTVAVSHDAVFAGRHIRVPVTDRVAGLIEIGFLVVDLPDLSDLDIRR